MGEAVEGAGSIPTTLWLMEEDDAVALASKIIALADRYGHGGSATPQ